MFQFLKGLVGGADTDYKQMVAEGAIIVDVRTPGEYQSGHIKGSLNIPVDIIKNKLADLKKKNKPVITCCRSGARSGMAKDILSNAGITVYNGGPWNSLEKKLQ
ncbi:MAG: rhodanese-like domain-containing protein [Bacteroidota bacterium]|jgi:phage shock protein E